MGKPSLYIFVALTLSSEASIPVENPLEAESRRQTSILLESKNQRGQQAGLVEEEQPVTDDGITSRPTPAASGRSLEIMGESRGLPLRIPGKTERTEK